VFIVWTKAFFISRISFWFFFSEVFHMSVQLLFIFCVVFFDSYLCFFVVYFVSFWCLLKFSLSSSICFHVLHFWCLEFFWVHLVHFNILWVNGLSLILLEQQILSWWLGIM
jgi:hypothetical protein